MPTNEPARLHLYEQAQASWGEEAATTLMTALPWDVAELATKQDLRELQLELSAKIERSAKGTIVTLGALMVTLAGVIVGAAQIGH